MRATYINRPDGRRLVVAVESAECIRVTCGGVGLVVCCRVSMLRTIRQWYNGEIDHLFVAQLVA